MKIRIINENYLHEELLEEGKEDNIYKNYVDNYDGMAELPVKDFAEILKWIYGGKIYLLKSTEELEKEFKYYLEVLSQLPTVTGQATDKRKKAIEKKIESVKRDIATSDKVDEISDIFDEYVYSSPDEISMDSANELTRTNNRVKRSRNKKIKYIEWIINQVVEKRNDVSVVLKSIEVFEKYKTQLSKTDIKQYDTIKDIYRAYEKEIVRPRVDKERDKFKQTDNKFLINNPIDSRELVWDYDNLVVVRPLTAEASCTYGKGSAWCIAMRQTDGEPTSFFDNYTTDQSKVFYFVIDFSLPKGHENRMVSIQANRKEYEIEGYWDINDNPVTKSPKKLNNLQDVYGWAYEEIMTAIQLDLDTLYKEPDPVHVKWKHELSRKIRSGDFNTEYININRYYGRDQDESFLTLLVESKFLICNTGITNTFPLEIWLSKNKDKVDSIYSPILKDSDMGSDRTPSINDWDSPEGCFYLTKTERQIDVNSLQEFYQVINQLNQTYLDSVMKKINDELINLIDSYTKSSINESKRIRIRILK